MMDVTLENFDPLFKAAMALEKDGIMAAAGLLVSVIEKYGGVLMVSDDGDIVGENVRYELMAVLHFMATTHKAHLKEMIRQRAYSTVNTNDHLI